MKFYVEIFTLWTTLLVLFSCNREEKIEPFHYDREVIAVFPPEGIEPHTFSGLVYRGLSKATDSLKLVFRLVLPTTYEEGLRKLRQFTTSDQDGVNRLIIVADPTYADDLVKQGIVDDMLDTDSIKVLQK